VAQILVAFSASLARDAERGRVVGTVQSGLILGILLARTVAGYVAAASSWRVVYFMAAGVMLVLAGVLWRELPRYREETELTYPQVLKSVGVIFREEPVLRRRALYGALSFRPHSRCSGPAWRSSWPLPLTGTEWGRSGSSGWPGVAGGRHGLDSRRLADRGRQALVTVATAAAMLLAFVMLAVAPRDLVVLIRRDRAASISGAQGMHVTNQSEILPPRRSGGRKPCEFGLYDRLLHRRDAGLDRRRRHLRQLRVGRPRRAGGRLRRPRLPESRSPSVAPAAPTPTEILGRRWERPLGERRSGRYLAPLEATLR